MSIRGNSFQREGFQRSAISYQLKVGFAGLFLAAAMALGQVGPDHPAIEYMTRPLRDPVAELGKVELRFEGEQGYLRSVLEALHVPVESQMAVFSKTSVQLMRIDPRTPRVLYFNDSVVVGWVPMGTLEVAALDPQQGMIFYTVDQREWVHQKRMAEPAAARKSLFERRTDCLSCHVSKTTRGVPGALMRSVFPSVDGTPIRELGVIDTDQRTPFEKRWGGWYVTGDSGAARHMGNAVVGQGGNLESLKGSFDSSRYPSPYSDIVALMVFEHQMQMMNLLIQAGWMTRAGSAERGEAIKRLVDSMLFIDEAPLGCKVRGGSGFAEKFSAQGPRDGQGRSLRQFDLERRLMRYPCSYMIYSDAFESLPVEAKDEVYRRMWRILSGEESSRLSRADREAVVGILQETKKGLPDYFRATGTPLADGP